MLQTVASYHPLWLSITRLGEAQLVLPATLALSWWVARQVDLRGLLWRWCFAFAAAVALTLATKLAFIGWGVGIPALDFTGISGHALFAAATYPLLLRLLLADQSHGWQRAAWVVGFLIAATVAVSRVVVGAHSNSEIVAGFVLGGAVVAFAGRSWRVRDVAPSLLVPLLLVTWFALHLPSRGGGVPSANTHGLVTWMALELSGRDAPFHREHLHTGTTPD